MRRKLLLGIFFSIILISISVDGQGLGDRLNSRVEITNFEAPDTAIAGKEFPVKVTIKNDRFLPVRTTVRVDLFDGLLNCIKKNIGEEPLRICRGRRSITIQINCTIREGDINWFKEIYNVQALLYQDFTFLGASYLLDRSTVQGIHVKSRFCEKDKVRIEEVRVIEELGEGEDEFEVFVTVINEGAFDALTHVQVDMIEKPSAIPALEELELDVLEGMGMAAVRKKLGEIKHEFVKSGCERELVIPCSLRKTESKEERFIIEAVLFVSIDGKEYQVDSSKVFEIYHQQSFCWEQDWLLVVVGVFAGLIALGIIVVIIRILYPLYHIKKIKLKEEKERIDERRKT